MVLGITRFKAYALYTLFEYCRIHQSHASRVPAGWSGSSTGGTSAPVLDLPWLAGTNIAYRVISIKCPGMPLGMGHRKGRRGVMAVAQTGGVGILSWMTHPGSRLRLNLGLGAGPHETARLVIV